MMSYKSTNNISNWLKKSRPTVEEVLERLGQEGVEALKNATPVDSSLTRESWRYEVRRTKKSTRITWFNTNIVDGVPVVILLEHGHKTKNGGYVQGLHFITPAIEPIMNSISARVWMEVSK